MISVASRLKPRTISAAVAYFLDMEGVTGSIPVSSTKSKFRSVMVSLQTSTKFI